ncbi:ribonuclease III domain-containing protein [Nemania sp. NC0429]|nr:ribonuclease III domain-containing protein [Nemania sp. NC0429]
MLRPAWVPTGLRSHLSRRCMPLEYRTRQSFEASLSMIYRRVGSSPASVPPRCLASTTHIKTALLPLNKQLEATHQQLLPDAEDAVDTATKISRAQQILNHEFQNEELLWEALQTPGSNVPMLGGRALTQGNKRLASLGDAVATMIIKHECYVMNYSIGETSDFVQRVVNNPRLISLCNEAGLTACINRNPSQRGIVSPQTLADTIEAVIGAVYLDGGINKARSTMKLLRII